MADVALTADQVGQIVTYVAPGVLACLGYRARFPGPDRAPGLVVAAAASLPLVALAQALLPGAQRPTQLGYVAALLLGSFVVGYTAAVIRGLPAGRRLLHQLGYRIQPEGSIYAQTIKHLSPGAGILVEFKDGRRIFGTPRNGPECKDDGIAELYLTHPEAHNPQTGEWSSVGAGLIVPLTEISNVVLSEDPTGAPPAALPRVELAPLRLAVGSE